MEQMRETKKRRIFRILQSANLPNKKDKYHQHYPTKGK